MGALTPAERRLVRPLVEAGGLAPASVDTVGHMHALYESEVRQLLTTTADDIDFSGARDVTFAFPGLFSSTRFASQPGWDQYFGYARLHAAVAGALRERAQALLLASRGKSALPEALRVAHLIAAAVARGSSRGRA